MSFLKEAEMKALKLAGLVLVLASSSALATDGQVFWNVSAAVSDAMGNPLDPAAIPDPVLAPGSVLAWSIGVNVTGDNQGLGGFVLNMGVWNTAGDVIAPNEIGGGTSTMDDGAGNMVGVFKAPGNTLSHGNINDLASAGGPGMNYGFSTGTAAAGKAYLAQLGAGYLDWIARYYGTYTGGGTRKKWQGNQTWGVGMASETAKLLWNPDGGYQLFASAIDLTGWAPGTYQIALFPVSAAVLKSGINLNTDQSGVTEAIPLANITGGTFDFIITPEPATLILLAAAGMLYRRRHA